MDSFDPINPLAAIAARDELTDALADDIGSIIAEYHRRAPGRSADGADLQTAILDELDAAFAGMDHDLGRKRIAAFRGKARERLAACTPVLSKRTELGHVRRCHGDLHLRNLVLIDGRPVPFDALEFDETLGTCDVLYDLAFLLMDLCYRGHPRAANIVQNSYLFAERGTQDSGLATMPLFLAVRAGIRAMVAVQTEHTASSRPSSTGTGRAYLELALTALTPPSPRLVAIGGRSGTGKTTLARQIAPDIGALPGAFHLRSDLERKALHGVNAGTRLPAEAYTEAEGQRVYTHLLARAEPVLRAGHSVLLDAVYLSPDARAEARALAERLDVPFTGIWLQADTEALIARVSARQADASDANSSCPIPDVHIDPRRSGLFMARSILREVRDGRRTC